MTELGSVNMRPASSASELAGAPASECRTNSCAADRPCTGFGLAVGEPQIAHDAAQRGHDGRASDAWDPMESSEGYSRGPGSQGSH